MPLSNVNIIETTPGILTISWTKDPLEGDSTTLANGAELCMLHFIANGPSSCDFPTPVILSSTVSQETVSHPNIIRDVEFVNGSLSFCDPLWFL